MSATPGESGRPLKDALEKLYEQYNRPEHLHPDPLEFVHLYTDRPDREVAGLSPPPLRTGGCGRSTFSVSAVLDRMGPSPSSFLLRNSAAEIRDTFHFFKHRFTTGAVLSALLEGLKS